ncbi:MAG: hypothetical protein JW769_00085 [Parachlamydiales bacterium]|nr:hypothetical protein [Parachlamydiales bacterium]
MSASEFTVSEIQGLRENLYYIQNQLRECVRRIEPQVARAGSLQEQIEKTQEQAKSWVIMIANFFKTAPSSGDSAKRWEPFLLLRIHNYNQYIQVMQNSGLVPLSSEVQNLIDRVMVLYGSLSERYSEVMGNLKRIQETGIVFPNKEKHSNNNEMIRQVLSEIDRLLRTRGTLCLGENLLEKWQMAFEEIHTRYLNYLEYMKGAGLIWDDERVPNTIKSCQRKLLGLKNLLLKRHQDIMEDRQSMEEVLPNEEEVLPRNEWMRNFLVQLEAFLKSTRSMPQEEDCLKRCQAVWMVCHRCIEFM